MERAVPTFEDVDRHRLGVVPPQFAGHAPEERERFDQSVEDGLGPLGGLRDGEGSVRVSQGDEKHGHLSATLREVHVDVPEVGLGTMTGWMFERDERLFAVKSVLMKITPNLIEATGVSVIGDEEAYDLQGGVP
jgi:hypothetical protein